MLIELLIDHLVLIDHLSISFTPGFNVLSGETGSGKSAILGALALILGERGDVTLIRSGNEKGRVTARFTPDEKIKPLLEQAGVDFPEEEILLCREISTNGKSRAFINNQPVTLTLLRDVSRRLIKMVSQHATHALLTKEMHRDLVDTFGAISLEKYRHAFSRYLELKTALKKWREEEASQLREIDRLQTEIEEIQAHPVKEGEEESLFQEYSRLSFSHEFQERGDAILQEQYGALQKLQTLKGLYSELEKRDPSFSAAKGSFSSITLELQELNSTLERALARYEPQPNRLIFLEEKLKALDRLKKKYGDFTTYAKEAAIRLAELMQRDEKIEELQRLTLEQEKLVDEYAKEITDLRAVAATRLERELESRLRKLEMAQVEFSIRLEPIPRTLSGDEEIEFFFKPNVGEREISVCESASGGELARLLLALETLLAGKEEIPTSIFDEIDASIGGKTAATVGDSFYELGKHQQVICITHFPQVALRADHHMAIKKVEREGRTHTTVEYLDAASKKRELARMGGR